MAEVKNNVWSVFAKSVKLYFTNFPALFKYMAFPVFGQIFGILLTLFATFFYAKNVPIWVLKNGVFNNFLVIFLILIVLILPGLLILAKALWDYLVAYGAVNSMVENMLKSGKIYDFPAHNEMISRRTGAFAVVWLIFGVLALIGMFPLFWVIAAIMAVYFVLVFQVFVFEPEKSPLACFQKSVSIIKGNFARTLGLLLLIGGFSCWFLPKIVNLLFDLLNFVAFLAIPFDIVARQLPINDINTVIKPFSFGFELTSLFIAKSILSMFLSYIVTGLTLPMRTICCALWYKALNKPESSIDKKVLARATGSK